MQIFKHTNIFTRKNKLKKFLTVFTLILAFTITSLAQTVTVKYLNANIDGNNPTGVECSNTTMHCTMGTKLLFSISPNPITGAYPGDLSTPTQNYNGLYIEAPTDCYDPNNNRFRMYIFGIYTYSGGVPNAGADIVAYWPGSVNPEYSSQTCGGAGYYSNTRTFTIHGMSGSALGTTPLNATAYVLNESPTTYKDFTALSGGTDAKAAANGYHYNTTTGALTLLKSCHPSYGTATCPVSTNGVANYVILYVNGLEKTSCSTESNCANNNLMRFKAQFTNTGISEVVTPPITYVGTNSYLQEQVNIKLTGISGDSFGAGAIYILNWVPNGIGTLPNNPDRSFIFLDPPNT